MSWNSFYLIPCKETPYSAGFKSLTYYRMLLYMFSKNGLENMQGCFVFKRGYHWSWIFQFYFCPFILSYNWCYGYVSSQLKGTLTDSLKLTLHKICPPKMLLHDLCFEGLHIVLSFSFCLYFKLNFNLTIMANKHDLKQTWILSSQIVKL